MSCYACTRRYGFFCKESGCPNCGYSFCLKCLKKEIEVPKCKNEKRKVCLSCFEKLEKIKQQTELEKDQQSKLKLTDNEFFTISEPISAPVLEPVLQAEEVFANDTNSNENNDDDAEIKKNLDLEITKRLAGLKTSKLTSDTDIAERLATLKDVPYKDYSKSDILLSKDVRSDQEKINDLLKQFVEETDIDHRTITATDPISDIEKRLAALRGEDPNNTKNKIPEEDESKSASKIAERYLEEAKLPDFLISEEEKELIAGLPPPSKNTEELPWCNICNEDANIRCIGCDGDLFCRNCFKEIHDDEEYRKHLTENYSKPPNFKDDYF